jgi:hypothetical protein
LSNTETGARIIRLADYRQSATPKIADGDFVFPTLYRITGYYFAAPEEVEEVTAEDLTPGDPAPPAYSLDPNEDGGLANARSAPMDQPDPAIDKGWIILRHHANLDLATGYQRGLIDGLDDIGWNQNLFETPHGVFTIHQRPAPPGKSTPVLVLARHENRPKVGEVDVRIAIGPDGTRFDPDEVNLDGELFDA